MRWVRAWSSCCVVLVLGCDAAVIERQVAVAERQAAAAEQRASAAEEAKAELEQQVEALEKHAVELEELAAKALAQAEQAKLRAESPSVAPTGEGPPSTSTGDCEKLGDKIVELVLADTEGLSTELVRDIAEESKAAIVESCKGTPVPKQTMDCVLAAKTLADLEECE